jgi:hypothetical protein
LASLGERAAALASAAFAVDLFNYLSFTPPIGSTSPRRLISPVIATSLRTDRPVGYRF